METPDGTLWYVEVKTLQAGQIARLPEITEPMLLVVALIDAQQPIRYYTIALPPHDPPPTRVRVVQSLISGVSALFVDNRRFELESIEGVNAPTAS